MILGEVLGGAFVCVAVDDVVDDGAVVRGSGAIGPEQRSRLCNGLVVR